VKYTFKYDKTISLLRSALSVPNGCYKKQGDHIQNYCYLNTNRSWACSN